MSPRALLLCSKRVVTLASVDHEQSPVAEDDGRSFATPIEASSGIIDATRPHLAALPEGGAVLVFQGREPDATGSWGRMRPYPGAGVAYRRDLQPGRDPRQSRLGVVSGRSRRPCRPGLVTWTDSDQEEARVVLARGRRVPSQEPLLTRT